MAYRLDLARLRTITAVPVDIAGVEARDPALRSLFVQFNALMCRAAGAGEGPWTHCERACISVLCGAIAVEGGWAVAEFRERSRTKQRAMTGYVDVRFELGRLPYAAEAKYAVVDLNGPGDISAAAARIARALIAAEDDLDRRVLPDRRPRQVKRIAIAFAYPRQTRAPRAFDALVREFRDTVGSRLSPDVLAWAFPANHRTTRSRAPHRRTSQPKGRIYPGLLVAARLIDG